MTQPTPTEFVSSGVYIEDMGDLGLFMTNEEREWTASVPREAIPALREYLHLS